MKEFHRYKDSQCASGSAMKTVATWLVSGCSLITRSCRFAASSTPECLAEGKAFSKIRCF